MSANWQCFFIGLACGFAAALALVAFFRGVAR